MEPAATWEKWKRSEEPEEATKAKQQKVLAVEYVDTEQTKAPVHWDDSEDSDF